MSITYRSFREHTWYFLKEFGTAGQLNQHAYLRTLAVQLLFASRYFTSPLFFSSLSLLQLFMLVFSCFDEHDIVLCFQSSVILTEGGGSTLGQKPGAQGVNPSGEHAR